MKKRSAYTLIEIIVVIAILGIVMAIVLPNSNYFKTMQEAFEVREFKRDMLYARNRAILDSKDYKITFDIKKNSYIIDNGIGNLQVVLARKTFKHGTKLISSDGNAEVVFKYNGTIGGSQTIYFNDRLGVKYRVSISPVAYRITIEKTNQK